MDEAYFKILRMIESGTISAEEGEMLLDALKAGPEPESESTNGTFTRPRTVAEESEHLASGPPAWAQRAWIYPLAVGVVLVGLVGMLTALLVGGGLYLGWLACTLPLMVFGSLVIALAWWSQSARWVHVRVHNQESRFKFSLPIPLRPIAWLARLARPWVPQMRDYPVDELILGLADMDEEDILAVEVNDDGEEVQVYLG
jgi:hypothetical protein